MAQWRRGHDQKGQRRKAGHESSGNNGVCGQKRAINTILSVILVQLIMGQTEIRIGGLHARGFCMQILLFF
jgi:hypothetical protein